MKLFRDLTPEEEADFRKHARENYKPSTPILDVWHPVYQDECCKINKEADLQLKCYLWVIVTHWGD